MNYKQIQTSREIRLWITGIVGPVVIGAATIIASDPELLRQTKVYVGKKYKDIKNILYNERGDSMFKANKMQKYVEMQIESIKYQLEDKRFENRPDSIVQTLTAQKVILEQTLQYFKEI